MKRITHLLMVVLWISLSAIPLSSWGQTGDREVLMPQLGKVECEVAPGEVITFKDPLGGAGYTGYDKAKENSLAGIVFKPAQSGYVIQVNFESLDIKCSAYGNYKAYVNIYNGVISEPEGYAYPESGNDLTTDSSLPYDSSMRLDSLNGTYTSLLYRSTDNTGAVSVGFFYNWASSCKGWVATVTCIEAKDMAIIGAGSSYEQIDQEPIGKEAVSLFSFYVEAEGFMNADHLTSVSFTLPTNENVVDAAQLKLYAGQGATFKGQADLGAAFTESNGTYTLTLDKELSAGKNWFTVAGNIRTDAVFASKVQAVLSKVTTNAHLDGIKNVAVATPVTLTVPYMVLMSATSTTYQVGDNSIYFYDDGGKDGSISEKFEGQVTFKPTTEGKKVMIDFTKLDLFNTSSTGLNDLLNIYYGDAVDEGKLALTLLKEKAAVIKSNAADGALTVTLKSSTGIPKSGFEAVVSEFVPQQMSVKEIVTSQYTEGTVCAGDQQQLILSFNINTENTEPVLTAGKFSFTTNGTFEQLSKATLYYTGGNGSFDSLKKIGEVVVSSDAFVITPVESISLKEGNNYFWLVYDVKGNARTNDVIDAAVTSVSCQGKDMTVTDGNPEGNRKVENKYLSVIGNADKTVYGTWMYEHSPQSEYSSNYSGTAGEQIVTFRPGTAGMIMEMEFSKFSIRYYSYAGGDPVFKIYSGTETTGELLWSLTKDNKDIGPGVKVRSTSADGALTVVFDANNNAGSTGNGWHAEVREYLPKNMAYEGVEVSQTNTEYVASGSTNQEMLRLKIMTSGDKNPLPLNKISLGLKGSQSNINKVSVFYTGKSDAFTADRLIGSLDITGTEESVEVPIDADYTLEEGDCYYWIAYDLKADAVPAQLVDAELLSLSINNVAQPIASGDPEGNREVKNVYLMPTSGHETVHVGTYPYMFYDDGGADGKYSSTQNGSITFVPADGQVIKIEFRQFKVSSGDYLRFYNGDDTSKNLLAEYSMYSEPEISSHILSDAADGSVTVKFGRTGYSVNDGWEIEVTSYTPLPLAYNSVITTAVNRKQLLGGSSDEKMLCMALETTGDKGSFTVDELSFAVTNSGNLSAAKVYYTGTNDVFSPEATLFGTVQTGEAPAFSGNQAITGPGTYYFWLACDIRTEATVGAEITFVPTEIKVNGVSVELGIPETASLIVKDGFRGTHTVGVDGEYKTLAAAIADMGVDGINGPVVLEVESGSYDEAVVIPEIAGTSATNTITIKSATGNYSDVIISSSHYNAPDYGGIDNGIVTISGTDYLNIEGITFTTADQAYPYLVDIRNASNYVTIRNCYFQRPVEAVAKRHLLHTDFVNGSVDGIPNTNMTIENNIFEGGYIGIEVGGQNAVEVNRNTGTRVLDNVFRNQSSKAIYTKYDVGTLVEGNTIMSSCGGVKEYCGIDMLLAYGGVNIRNNKITLSGNYAIGIKVRPIIGKEDVHGSIYNNVVNINSGQGNSSYGIHLSNAQCAYLDVVNNTVRMIGTDTESAGFFNTTRSSNVTLQNNIFQNEAGGYAYRINSTSSKVLSFNNNILYSSGETLVYTAESLTMEQWLALGRETGSYNERVTFLSDEILAPKVLGNLNNGKPLDYVTVDITGTARNAEHPTIGAYEYVEPTSAVMEEGYPILSGKATHNAAMVLVKATENAEIYYLCKTVNEAPTADEIIAADNKAAVSKGQETTIRLNGLKGGTDYYTFFVLKTLANEVLSGIYPLDRFTTAYLPTTVSTFEGITVTEGVFEDGTASFEGFVTETIEDGMGENNHKAARMTGGSATITLTNTASGLPLTGFYLKSDADVTVAVSSDRSKRVASTNNEWIFCNLKDMGDIASVTLSTMGTEVFIDDFSGMPQPVTFLIDGVPDDRIPAGTEVVLSPYLYGGVPPYAYEWMNANHEELSTEETYKFAADITRDYTLVVTDAWGAKEESSVTVRVGSEALVATFDDLYLADESFNDCTKYEDGEHIFHSGTYEFMNVVGTSYGQKYWSGFTYSNSTSTLFTGNYIKEQYNSAVGNGVNDSRNYAVAYVASNDGGVKVTVANAEEEESINGCYVSNNAWAVDAITSGDGTAGDEGFVKDDYFMLTATGYKADGTVSATADFYLADYRSGNEADHYYLDTWQWFDLRPLGKVKEISFTMNSSKKNSYGITTPTYFCMDDFNGERIIKQGDAQTFGLGASTMNLAPLFTFTDAEASIVYRLEDAYNTNILSATIDNGELLIDGKAEGSADLVISAVQKGKKQFVRVPVTIDPSASGMANISGGTVSIYPVPAVDRLNIATDMERYRIEVITANGASVYLKDNNYGNTSIDVSGLEDGIYLLRISNEGTSVVKRFTKVK